MQNRPHILRRALVLLVVVVSLAAVALTYLAPGFSVDNGLVYGNF